jgi:hypothetical protein
MLEHIVVDWRNARFFTHGQRPVFEINDLKLCAHYISTYPATHSAICGPMRRVDAANDD